MEEQQIVDTQPAVEQPMPKSPFADSPYVMNPAPQYQIPVTPQPAKKKKSGAGKIAVAVLLAVALIAGSSVLTAALVNRNWEARNSRMNEAMNNRLNVMQNQLDILSGTGVTGTNAKSGESLTPGQVYAQNVRSVVAVTCVVQQYDPYYGQSSGYESFGSGFILSKDGYVVSNYHVVEGASSIRVILSDGEEYVAELVGYDASNDVSLLKIQGENFPCVQIGSSEELIVGDQVVAIGNPLGELTSTLTVGYVSAKDRIVTTDGTTTNMLQTDAAINSGNSGGPLFNMYGEVVGITTAKYSGTSESGASIEGIGFAIPMDDVMGIIEDLQEYGYVKSAYLGVLCRDVSADAVRDGLPAGVYVEEVTAGYCAEAAGVKMQDIIVDVGGYAVTNTADLTRALRKLEPEQATTITVYRKGSELVLHITLDEKPVAEEQTVQTPSNVPQYGGMGDWYWDFFDDFFG